ncbi:hypothetical protein BO71DRAFT_19246 [Aspergillus ellipticus CBS 707.79]|uniref:Uncharacterized protein n=1 Tax=Aspergillus ellipticus CBS 707.79 TaxID=1448320 RepID=A0A319D5A2_9EURO|nr:hypothetical protein BO71DRAFT_19246 [Aspergillus ellipticus CBS 707.79]
MKGGPAFKWAPLPKLHHPLPRSPRQSQAFLNALTTSFRRQLDREFPTNESSASEQTTNVSRERLPENPNSSAHAADKHLRNILDNPLFRVARPQSNCLGEASTERLLKEPTVVFDEMVATGNVTRSLLHKCLTYQLHIATAMGGDVLKALRDSKLGSKVVNWWLASDSHSRKLLFQHSRLTEPLSKFMVAEGMQDTALVWLGMLARQNVGGHDGLITEFQPPKSAGLLLSNFLAAENKYGGGLASSMRYYLLARDVCVSEGISLDDSIGRKVFLPAGNHLLRWIREADPKNRSKISLHDYEEYTRLMETSSPKSLLASSAYLYHPTHPDPKPFFEFARGASDVEVLSWPKAKRDHLMQTGYDALRVLMDQGNDKNAAILASVLQRHLPDDLKGTQTTRKKLAEAETLHLLDQLDPAFA